MTRRDGVNIGQQCATIFRVFDEREGERNDYGGEGEGGWDVYSNAAACDFFQSAACSWKPMTRVVLGSGHGREGIGGAVVVCYILVLEEPVCRCFVVYSSGTLCLSGLSSGKHAIGIYGAGNWPGQRGKKTPQKPKLWHAVTTKGRLSCRHQHSCTYPPSPIRCGDTAVDTRERREQRVSAPSTRDLNICLN